MRLKISAPLLVLTLLLTLALGYSPVTASPDQVTFSLYPSTICSFAGHGFNVILKFSNTSPFTGCFGWNVTVEWASGDFEVSGQPLLTATGLIPDWAWLPGGSSRGTVTDGKISNISVISDMSWYWGSSVPPDPDTMAGISFVTERAPPDAGMPINITYAEYLDNTGVWQTALATGVLVTSPPPPTQIEWLIPWTSSHDLSFLDNCIDEYHALHPEVFITITSVPFEDLWDVIALRHSIGADPDMYYMQDAWIPDMVNAEMLSIPSAAVQDNVKANWSTSSVKGCTYQFTVWGYPAGLDGEALVYNEKILNETVGYENIPPKGEPWTWDALKNIATASTTRGADGMINRTGFCFLDYPPDYPRFTFTELLWSNGGKEYAVPRPPEQLDREILFNSSEGNETLGWINSLINVTYTPGVDYGVLGDGWKSEKVAMMILPSWIGGSIKDAMGSNFTDLEIAPIPVGPHGTHSWSHVHSWLNTVSKAAESRRDHILLPTHAEVAWDFIKWLNTPQPTSAPYGRWPNATGTTRMGDFLVYDSLHPSRQSDINVYEPFIQAEDFWLYGFRDAYYTYGRADDYFVGYADYSSEISVDLLEPILEGADVTTTINNVAPVVFKKLPLPGDLDHNDIVDIFDIVIISVAFGSRPGDPNWDPRADVKCDGIVDIYDLVFLGIHFGIRD